MKVGSWMPSVWRDRREVDPLSAMRNEMDELFRSWAKDFGGFGAMSKDGASLAPAINVSETPAEIRITAELPGVEQKDIDVTLVGNQLTIKGEKRSEHEEKKDEKDRMFHRVERSYGSFQRIMTVPAEIDPAKVKADFKDGVLTVVIPKPPEAKSQQRRIEVKGAA